MPKRRKASAAPAAKKKRQVLELVKGPQRLHWRNHDGYLVPLDVIGTYGIQAIYRKLWTAPDASFPRPATRECWLRAVREHAASRAIQLPELTEAESGQEFVEEREEAGA